MKHKEVNSRGDSWEIGCDKFGTKLWRREGNKSNGWLVFHWDARNSARLFIQPFVHSLTRPQTARECSKSSEGPLQWWIIVLETLQACCKMEGWKSHIAPYTFSSQIWQVMWGERTSGFRTLQNKHRHHISYLLFESWRNLFKGTGNTQYYLFYRVATQNYLKVAYL